MIKSMTGYGKGEALLATGKITFEIRTLNGKGADINLKTSILPKEKELPIRQKLASSLQRGTIDFFASWEENSVESSRKLNADLIKQYCSQIKDLRDEITPSEAGKDLTESLLAAVLRFPDVFDNKKADIITEENWPVVEKAIDEAIEAVNDYRSREGVTLYKDVTSRVGNILQLENEVEGYEQERIDTVRARILKNLEALSQQPDPNRFEQEMIYYMEKLDINEEKVRLRQHCKYFMETIDTDPFPGKKLGFIIQEMGREINTTGSKANHTGIQAAVVRMKDELEKIREQSMNIL